MDMTWAMIVKGNIEDYFWSEIILAMTHIKNLRFTSMLQGLSSHKSLHNKPAELSHLRILGSIIYILIHEEKQELKSEKFILKALRDKLVGFDGYIIYHVYVEE